ncbi:hypothetical protein FB446DRAFT_790306 [Lentinula raphanica]|nr:hypothetical protein FB446DRAFT_790306 [Lentinula raphanica]
MDSELRMVPTHRGSLFMGFSEAFLFSTGVSVAGDVYIWLVVLAGLQLWSLRITFKPDGNMTFHKPYDDIRHLDERIMERAFGNRDTKWVKYDVHGGPDGDVSIVRTIIGNDVLPDFGLYDLESYGGLFCGTLGSDEHMVANIVM